MPTGTSNMPALSQLQRQIHVGLLDLVDKLRAQGINQHVALPQLIVCGDQSSGKSSVLEAISQMRFPTKNQLCVRFATELVLRKTRDTHVHVSIIPGPSRSLQDQQRLRAFEPDVELEGLPGVIDDAKAYLEAPEAGATDAFRDDILRVCISGPARPDLTLINLPGLTHPEHRQQSIADVEPALRLVRQYMREPRSIILAVVSAQDYANQTVTQLVKECDPEGQRTLGIITKPDILEPGSETEKAAVTLASNKDVALSLGWHVLRNRDLDNGDSTFVVRDEAERQFFSQGIWQELPPQSLGITALRERLSAVLTGHITTVLPSLAGDIEVGIAECRIKLERLGPARLTLAEKRAYLTAISHSFENLVRKGVDGTYHDPFFIDSKSGNEAKNLRAMIRSLNDDFAFKMRQCGHSREILPDDKSGQAMEAGEGLNPTHVDSRPEAIRRAEFINELKDMVRRKKGPELPGTFNPLLAGELFRLQSSSWEAITGQHIKHVWTAALAFLEAALTSVTDKVTSQIVLCDIIDPAMNERLEALTAKVQELLRPHRRHHPMTCDESFTEVMQDLRDKRRANDDLMRLTVFGFRRDSNSGSNRVVPSVAVSAASSTSVSPALPGPNAVRNRSVEEDGYVELLDCMETYYKIAVRTYVDNVASLAVESCLVDGLADVFSPSVVSNMHDDMIEELIEAEPEAISHERSSLQTRLGEFEVALRSCKRLGGRAPTQLPAQLYQRAPPTPSSSAYRPRTPVSEPDRNSATVAATAISGGAQPDPRFQTPVQQRRSDTMDEVSGHLAALSISDSIHSAPGATASPQSLMTSSGSSSSQSPNILVSSPSTPASSAPSENGPSTPSPSMRKATHKEQLGSSSIGHPVPGSGSPGSSDASRFGGPINLSEGLFAFSPVRSKGRR